MTTNAFLERNERMKERIAKIIQDGVCLGDSSWDEITLEILKAMREPTEKMLGAIHGCYPDIPDKYASIIAKQRWQSAIDAVIND